MEWRIGCSGYYYPEWRRHFYPGDLARRDWFEYYCSHFNSLELNVTYYRFPRAGFLERWYDRSPADFTFSVKAPRHITHFKRFKEAQQMLDDFIGTARQGLRQKLGCVLFQFPAHFDYQPERLFRITEMLDASVRNVVEFRHPSWWNSSVFGTLEQGNIAFCGMSHPNLPAGVVKTADTIYYRLHGVPDLYSSRYETADLERVVSGIVRAGGREAYVYFNNTADGYAVVNGKELQNISEFVH